MPLTLVAPVGIYTIVDLVDELDRQSRPHGVRVSHNSIENGDSVVKFLAAGRVMTLGADSEFASEPKKAWDRSLRSLLGFSPIEQVVTESVYVVGAPFEDAALNVLTQPPPQGVSLSTLAADYDIYRTRQQAWQAFEAKYDKRRFIYGVDSGNSAIHSFEGK